MRTGTGPHVGVDAVSWALLGFGIPGLKPLMIVALVAAALYWRPGSRLLGLTPYGRMVQPFLNLVPTRPFSGTTGPSPPKRHGRVYWALIAAAVATLAALIATRIAVQTSTGLSH